MVDKRKRKRRVITAEKAGTTRPKSTASASKPQVTGVPSGSLAMWVGTPDKPHVVAAAVATELQTEGRWPPNDITKMMSTDYHYTQFSIGNFLNQVQERLASGVPSYTFVFDGAFVIKALAATVGVLMVAVNAQTA
jgi:hypothetical protein